MDIALFILIWLGIGIICTLQANIHQPNEDRTTKVIAILLGPITGLIFILSK